MRSTLGEEGGWGWGWGIDTTVKQNLVGERHRRVFGDGDGGGQDVGVGIRNLRDSFAVGVHNAVEHHGTSPPPGKMSPDKFGRTRTPDNFGGDNFGRTGPPGNFQPPARWQLPGGDNFPGEVATSRGMGCITRRVEASCETPAKILLDGKSLWKKMKNSGGKTFGWGKTFRYTYILRIHIHAYMYIQNYINISYIAYIYIMAYISTYIYINIQIYIGVKMKHSVATSGYQIHREW